MIDKEEIKKVSDTIEIVKSNIEEYEILYSNLLKENADEQYIQNMSKIYSNKLKNLNNAVSVPYFARVDFKEDKQNNIQKIYIGKTGIFNDDYEVVVTDWRAPISSIYYDGQLGNVEYECPDGIIKGDLSKKRVYTIENSILKDYQDIDITTNDEFLQECLNENSEARLKNIISTIQSEQNKIIRAKMSNPLFYIQNRFWGNINNLKLEHIVIDEAQDLGEFQFYNFKEIVKPNMSMTILGDISQGIYSYKGINNWNKLNQIVFDNKASIEYLKESYRTSMEIMNEANTIINKIVDNENIILAQPIERHGDKVEHWKIDSEDSKISKIYEIIKTHLEAGHINIAVITKDFDESIELHKKLTNYEVDIKLISENLDKYTGGTIIIPSYLSKGLEFDSVIISDSNKYSENILDTKLLYVACTRAMHTLDIISQ